MTQGFSPTEPPDPRPSPSFTVLHRLLSARIFSQPQLPTVFFPRAPSLSPIPLPPPCSLLPNFSFARSTRAALL